jgi:branched-chain amino acid transport system substrate-binding protein
LGTLGLAACHSSETGAPVAIDQSQSSARGTGDSGQVAILVPLTGKLADLGKSMVRAAQLSLSVPGSPVLEVKDTHGTPQGAAAAAREAVASGVKMILGPLTSAETAQVAPITRAAGVPVLAFTNDQAQSQPGVWTLGITFDQQIRRLAGAVHGAGREPIAALLPDNDLGKAMAESLNRVMAAQGVPPPFIHMHGRGEDAIETAVDELAGTAPPDQAVPFGAVLLGSTGGDLKYFARAFADAKIDRRKIQVLGPALWVDPASGSNALIGAWFAGPDPDTRRDMTKQYTAKYKDPPRPIADLAHDAASIARVLGAQHKMNAQGLTQQLGFTGVDGWFAMLPDGQVLRGLAVFRVDRLRAVKIGPAPRGPAAPGS